MSRFKLINLIDKLFITCCIFLIAYAWINFFIRNLWLTFIFSLIFSLSFSFIVFYLANKKNEKKTSNINHSKMVETNFLAFQLLSKQDKLETIKNIVKKNFECIKKNNSLIYFQDQKKYQIMMFFDYEKLNQFNLLKLISKAEKNINFLKIICCDFEPNLNTEILNNLEIELIDKTKFYDEYFLPNNLVLNTSNLITKTKRKTLKEIAKNFFVPNKTKSYFFCGLILIFSSLILPYHTYYLIFGTTFLIFSILCKFSKYFYRR